MAGGTIIALLVRNLPSSRQSPRAVAIAAISDVAIAGCERRLGLLASTR